MNIRTDLALENLEIAGEILPEGVKKESHKKENLTITKVEVTSDSGANILGKPIGTYITIEMDSLKGFSDNFEGETEVVAEQINQLLPKEGLVLVIGLGNEDITPDAIGPQVVSGLLATRHLVNGFAQEYGLGSLRPVAAVAPGVLGQTGMETAEIVHSLCRQIKPAAVVAVDALASRSVERLGTTVQIADTGISPGSGVQNQRAELSRQSLGIPVIAVGVPTVVDMTTIAYDLLGEGYQSEKVSDRGRTMMVTPREIDKIIKQAAKTVAAGLNRALQPELSMEEIVGLTA
ncbi:GPR endopeptidase [[Clostridium] methylpentosum DSM 5476]|uniref:Germination protease n=1 Tax=[Clostridium] methylpentosum DSM 5476 TaxID=537013 RepID=C0E960_9FIRM|nr:GPR endopeptidase [[Clostridium] methylpentosum DSM 5476]MDY3989522.1 GPR endopeptidase [Massilioclostridium sp.]MEE1491053.1 GPR endopeptidase [Massilioclostridium sp.]